MSDADARPFYEVPRPALLSFGVDLLLGRRRSFLRDAEIVMRANAYPRRVEGVEHVPAAGAFVLVMNHLSRRGLRPYHCAMVVTQAVAGIRAGAPDIRWAFTSEYLGRRIGPVPIPLSLIRWTFRRVAQVYGFVVIQRREELTAGRAAALRRLERLLREGHPLGLTPEGAVTGATGPLVEPPAGSGRFLAALHEPLLPVGLFEEGDALVVRFGEPFELRVPRAVSREEQDVAARTEVMSRIGELLPEGYRGVYAEAVRGRLAVKGGTTDFTD